MLLTGVPTIKEVILFPTLRPEASSEGGTRRTLSAGRR